jgi:L-ascorbate metabolism protein UlaG (beta-lactamase superfamily)
MSLRQAPSIRSGRVTLRLNQSATEDPDGTRILYDAGRTVRGPDDPRLGKIDAVLLSHVHGDHLGDVIQPAASAGECGRPDFSVKATPNSNTASIAAAKKARIVVGSEMNAFLARKVKDAGGDSRQVQLVRFGASARVGGVTLTTVPAAHSNGLAPAFLSPEHAQALEQNGLTAYVGPPTGYVVRFSNGLTVYLSSDTGVTAEQDLVVRGYYAANLAVMNVGDEGSRAPAAERQDDGVRRQGHVRGRLLSARGGRLNAAGARATRRRGPVPQAM